MRVAVIGGGITGFFASYYLAKSGNRVTIINHEIPGIRTSIYNGGLIVPSFAPTPIGLRRVLAMNLSGRGPVLVSPIEVARNFSWFRIALRKGLKASESTLIEFGRQSLERYNDFFREESIDADLQRGVLGVYLSAEQAQDAARSLKGRWIDRDEVTAAGLTGLAGGVLFDDELSINPAKLIAGLAQRLREMGVNIIPARTTALRTENGRATAAVDETGRLSEADAFVISTGAWAKSLCGPLGLDPMVLPARGLATIFDTGGSKVLSYPTLLEDYGISLTQHNERTLRLTSLFDLVGFDSSASSRRSWVMGVVERHLAGYANLSTVEEGIGYRPCTPDHLPLVGRVPGYANVFVATGNCRLGVTLAPATGHLVKSMIDRDDGEDKAVSFDPARFSLGRTKHS